MENPLGRQTDALKKVFIAYRVYPSFSKYADKTFFNTKYEMFRTALSTFVKSLEGTDYFIHFIMDSCPSDYLSYIETILPPARFKIESHENAGNRLTFLMQIDTLLKQNHSQYIYFAEDDYIYSPSSMIKMINAMEKIHVDFVSPYDHPDLYSNTNCTEGFKYNHNYKTRVFYIEGFHFRTTSSTTLTFLTTVETLKRTQKTFKLFKRYQLFGRIFPQDYEMWLSLTHMKHKSLSFAHTGAMYFSLFPQFFRKKYTLITPIPGFAFHLNTPCIERYGSKIVSDLITTTSRN
ncbi:MAG: hypothetical protein M1290_01805 [Candidatus Thermoplasmatota archaeon]|jgi:hypothetical protein|nr:hypothetical protein [Candidatus Thermoplasmatota archaeon]